MILPLERFILLLIGLSLVLLPVVGCGSINDLDKYTKAVSPLEQKFKDADTLGQSTARIALSPIVSNMQGIKQQTQDLKVPKKLQEAHGELLDYMDYTINGYLAFMDDEDIVAKYWLEFAKLTYDIYQTKLVQVKKGG